MDLPISDQSKVSDMVPDRMSSDQDVSLEASSVVVVLFYWLLAAVGT